MRGRGPGGYLRVIEKMIFEYKNLVKYSFKLLFENVKWSVHNSIDFVLINYLRYLGMFITEKVVLLTFLKYCNENKTKR